METQDKIHREETRESHNPEILTDAFIPDQWCYCRPRVFQEGRGARLTFNDLRTNVCNTQTHTLGKKNHVSLHLELCCLLDALVKNRLAPICAPVHASVPFWIEMLVRIS